MFKALQNFLVEQLEKTHLYEMAYNRSRYIDEVDNLLKQLIENWCLIRYCTISGEKQELKNHWKQELKAHIDNLAKMSVKVDKTKTTRFALIDQPESKNVDWIIQVISMKFDEENIDVNLSDVEEAATDLVEYGLDELVEIICAKYNYNNIKDYVNSI